MHLSHNQYEKSEKNEKNEIYEQDTKSDQFSLFDENPTVLIGRDRLFIFGKFETREHLQFSISVNQLRCQLTSREFPLETRID